MAHPCCGSDLQTGAKIVAIFQIVFGLIASLVFLITAICFWTGTIGANPTAGFNSNSTEAQNNSTATDNSTAATTVPSTGGGSSPRTKREAAPSTDINVTKAPGQTNEKKAELDDKIKKAEDVAKQANKNLELLINQQKEAVRNANTSTNTTKDPAASSTQPLLKKQRTMGIGCMTISVISLVELLLGVVLLKAVDKRSSKNLTFWLVATIMIWVLNMAITLTEAYDHNETIMLLIYRVPELALKTYFLWVVAAFYFTLPKTG